MRPVPHPSPEVPARFRLSVPAQPAALAPIRRSLRHWLAYCGVRGERASDVVLAVTEACSNSVEHAYDQGGMLDIRCDRFTEHMSVVISDQGRWRPTDNDPLRGRGMEIIHTLIPDSRIETSSAGTKVRLCVPLGQR